MDVAIRDARPDDAPRIRDIHLAAIEELGPQAYDPEQVTAWAHDRDPTNYPINTTETVFVVATTDEDVVGFGWLTTTPGEYLDAAVDGEITAIYVHPDFAREGVGSRIYAALETAAIDRGLDSLGAWATLNAIPFYRKQGFTRVTDQQVEYDDVTIPVVEMTNEALGEPGES